MAYTFNRCDRSPVLEIIHQHIHALAFRTKVLDDDTRAPDDLSRVTLLVDLAQSSPLPEHLGVADLDEVDLVLCTECFDELDVLGFGARLDEHAKMGFALVEGFGTFAQAAGEAIVREGVLQDLLLIETRV